MMDGGLKTRLLFCKVFSHKLERMYARVSGTDSIGLVKLVSS